MPSDYVHERRVEFAETDMAGIVHFANFFRYMEAAEHAFFRSLGLVVHRSADGAMQGWARVDAGCTYRAPLRYGDRFAVHLRVRRKGRSSLGFDLEFHLLERDGSPVPPGEPVATGTLDTVHVQRGAGEEGLRSAPVPEAVAARIQVAGTPPAVPGS